ncbi:MAG: tRNA (adenosine(37)-N6)-dimethylallyltransferase MiaA [Flavobacteriaceae bacterium]
MNPLKELYTVIPVWKTNILINQIIATDVVKNSMNSKTLIYICGATAIGKTALSIKLAQAFNTEIISCDSRQFYKEMRIGTAVPNSEELAAAPHHFIQNMSISKDYSVGDYEKESLSLTQKLFDKHDVLILVGGSGLYADALIEGLDYFPSIDPQIRIDLKAVLENQGIEVLQEKLKTVDLDSYNTLDIHNPQRLIRALEVFIGTGNTFSSYKKNNKSKRNFKTIRIGLEADRALMYERINLRVDLMMQEGLLDEVKSLEKFKALNAMQTVGYRELFRYLSGEIDLDFAISEIKKNTRRFAKRQVTWNKRNPDIKWFDFQTPFSDILDYLKLALNG